MAWDQSDLENIQTIQSRSPPLCNCSKPNPAGNGLSEEMQHSWACVSFQCVAWMASHTPPPGNTAESWRAASPASPLYPSRAHTVALTSVSPLWNQLGNAGQGRFLNAKHKSLSSPVSLLATKITYGLRPSTFRKLFKAENCMPGLSSPFSTVGNSNSMRPPPLSPGRYFGVPPGSS